VDIYRWSLGRGEFIRLAFEEAAVAYNDHFNAKGGGSHSVLPYIQNKYENGKDNPAILALQFYGSVQSSLSQLPNILFYLESRFGLIPGKEWWVLNCYNEFWIWRTWDDEIGRLHVNQCFYCVGFDQWSPRYSSPRLFTPIHYEGQKLEALRAAQSFREFRILNSSVFSNWPCPTTWLQPNSGLLGPL